MECQRFGIATDGFYSAMREGHKYDANDNQYLDTVWRSNELRGGAAGDTHPLVYSSLCDSDLNPIAPICIGMDYNANINWIVAEQPCDRRLNIIKSFYVKF